MLFRSCRKRPAKVCFSRNLQKRPTKETYKRDLQKRPTKETYLWCLESVSTTNSPVFCALCALRDDTCQKRPTYIKRDIMKGAHKHETSRITEQVGLYDVSYHTHMSLLTYGSTYTETHIHQKRPINKLTNFKRVLYAR